MNTFFVRRPYLDRIYRMDILIKRINVFSRMTEKQYRTINILPTKTQTIILIKPNQTQYSEEFQKNCPFDKKGRMHGFFVRTCLNKQIAHLDSLVYVVLYLCLSMPPKTPSAWSDVAWSVMFRTVDTVDRH